MTKSLSKIHFIIFQLIFIAQGLHAQQNTPEMSTKNDIKAAYLKRRTLNNNEGWECVTGGVLIGMIGGLRAISGAVNATYSNSDNKVKSGNTIFIIGNAIALASIPFFIAAHKYKQKAQLALNDEELQLNNKHVNAFTYPALRLTVNF